MPELNAGQCYDPRTGIILSWTVEEVGCQLMASEEETGLFFFASCLEVAECMIREKTKEVFSNPILFFPFHPLT